MNLRRNSDQGKQSADQGGRDQIEPAEMRSEAVGGHKKKNAEESETDCRRRLFYSASGVCDLDIFNPFRHGAL
jgi:hypothetical protein